VARRYVVKEYRLLFVKCFVIDFALVTSRGAALGATAGSSAYTGAWRRAATPDPPLVCGARLRRQTSRCCCRCRCRGRQHSPGAARGVQDAQGAASTAAAAAAIAMVGARDRAATPHSALLLAVQVPALQPPLVGVAGRRCSTSRCCCLCRSRDRRHSQGVARGGHDAQGAAVAAATAGTAASIFEWRRAATPHEPPLLPLQLPPP